MFRRHSAPEPGAAIAAKLTMLDLVEVVAILVLALIGLAAAVLLGLRALGLDPAWLAQTRHSLREARYRASEVLAEFGDWLRLGR
jgi:hypothetical protein